MKIVLDTHTFLWFIDGNQKLSANARTLIEDMNNERLLSIASVWEMAIKYSIGRLQFAQPFQAFMSHQLTKNSIQLLDINFDHTTIVASLPFHHKDPFDRMIIAQSIVEQVPIISIDTIFDAYGATRLW